jgi:5-hydroxyisourate hydrolase-like protein (transthyretin family)
MPKGPGNRLILLPNDDQPYFMREVDVPDPVGLGPAQMEIELHRGIWITGRITDKATGEPAAGVNVRYFPFLNNEFAKRTPEFNPNGNVDGDQSRYQSQSDGSFRLVGLPGRAVIGAVSWWKSYRQGVGYDQIDAPKYDKTDHLLTYRNSIAPSSKFPNVMQEINPPAYATEFKVDLQLDPGAVVKIRVTDATGNPLTGVSVSGLTSLGYFVTESDAVITAVNLGPQETRIVLLEKKEMNLGRVLVIGPDEIRAGETIAQLRPCAKITGQVLLDDGTPFSGLAVEPRVLPFGDFGRRLESVATDAEGRFQTTLLPGCKYNLSGMGGSFQYVELAKELSVEPGQTLDLGTLKLNKDGKLTSWKP